MKFAKYLSLFLLLALSTAAWCQTADPAAAGAAAPDADQLPRTLTYLLVIAGAIIFIAAMFYVVKVNQFLYKRVIDLEAAKSGTVLSEEALAKVMSGGGDSLWDTLRKKYWEDAVPIEREHEILSHHDFDGIRELDNQLPPWWVNLFLITAVWAAIYMYYYHFGGGGPSSSDEYKIEMEQAKKQQAAVAASAANAVDETNVTALTDASALSEGEQTFKTTCAACHGQKGEGGVGPNMTDDYWIHGGGIKNVFKTIKYGVPDKGMISWQSQIKPGDMQKVASYILTLRGTNPPNAKAPQGDIWKEEAAAPAADTTATKK